MKSLPGPRQGATLEGRVRTLLPQSADSLLLRFRPLELPAGGRLPPAGPLTHNAVHLPADDIPAEPAPPAPAASGPESHRRAEIEQSDEQQRFASRQLHILVPAPERTATSGDRLVGPGDSDLPPP